MSKAKSFVFILIGAVCLVIVFKLIKSVDSGLAGDMIDFLDRYYIHFVVGLIVVAILGSILKKLLRKSASDKDPNIESRFGYSWIVIGSLAYGVMFVVAIEQDNYDKLIVPVIFVLAAVVPILYDRWDKFVDRHA